MINIYNKSLCPTFITFIILFWSHYRQSSLTPTHAFTSPPPTTTHFSMSKAIQLRPVAKLISRQHQLQSPIHTKISLRGDNIQCIRGICRSLFAVPVTLATTAATAATAATLTGSTTMLSSFLAPLGSILILAFIILVHESGHYIAAKQFNITVEEFSIGFGPKLFSSRSVPFFQQDEFNVRAIPLGGYVRFPENYNTTLAREIQLYEAQQNADFIRERQPSLIEQIINALSLGIVEDQKWQQEKKRRILELTTRTSQQKQTDKSIPFWKRFLSTSGGMGSVTPKARKTSTIDLTTEIEYYTDPSLLQNKPWIERAIVLSGGVVFNILLAFILYFGQINFGSGLPIPIFDSGIVITSNPRPGTAANGLLQQGDIIVKVNGIDVMSLSSSSQKQTQISAISSQQAISEFIATIRSTKEGDTLALSVIRPTAANQFADDTLEPKIREVLVKPKRTNSKSGPMTIGALLAPNYKQTKLIQTSNPIDAATLAVKYVTTLTQETADGIFTLIRTLLIGILGIGATTGSNGATAAVSSVAGQVSGPLGLLRTGSQVISTLDITTIVLFTSAISINLAVINSLPFPALDGGQLVFVLSEAITGRKVNQQFQESLTTVAVLFLLLVSLSTFVGDLNSVFGR